MRRFNRIAVVGLGRMGLPTACLLRDHGYDVVGIDSSRDVRACIDFRDLPYEEPGLQLAGLSVAETHDGVSAEVWIIAIGTTRAGRLSDDEVLRVIGEVASRAKLIVVESTISPAAAARLTEFGPPIAVCPERARPGEVLADFATMPRLVGGATPEATELAVELYSSLTLAPLHRCTAVEAALAKLAENAEREVRIAFANELADAARAYGADPAKVIEAAQTHPRAEFLQPGIGVGGHCLPMATRWFAEQADGVARAARQMHDERPAATARRITEDLEPGARICVIGRTYRPNTTYHQPGDGSDPYAAPAVALIAALEELSFDVVSWDPADEDVTREQAEEGAALVFVAVPHDSL